MFRLLTCLLLGFILYVGYLWWNKLHGEIPPASGSIKTVSPRPQAIPPTPATTQQVETTGTTSDAVGPPVPPPAGQASAKAPVPMPASPHAAALNDINSLIEKGNDAEAEAKLAALPQAALDDPPTRKAVAGVWNNLGKSREKAQGLPVSLTAYKAAVSADTSNADANLNLFRAAWSTKDATVIQELLFAQHLTREVLEELVKKDPALPLSHLLLAQAFMKKEDLAGAATHIQHASERIGEDPKGKDLLEFFNSNLKQLKAEQKFVVRQSSHFMVKFDGNEDHVVWSRVSEILEDAYREIGQKFGYFPSKPILVVLHTKESFQDATGSPAWADGLFDPLLGRITIPTQGALTNPAWLAQVLRHEFVHALLHERVGERVHAVPTWLNEGLAMQLTGDPWPDIDQLVKATGRSFSIIPLTDLEKNWTGFNRVKALWAYLEGNSAAGYFIDRFGMEKVREVLGLLATGKPFPVALQDRLFIPYETFYHRWLDELNDRLRTGRTL